MKLWILQPNDLPAKDSPWIPIYDKVDCYVIRAETEHEARELAHSRGADENYCGITAPWRNPKYSFCTELLAEGDSGIVVRDFNAG